MANPDTGIHATQTRGFERPGAIGQVADNSPHNRKRDLINSDPQAVQVSTLQVTIAKADYDLTVGGIPFNLDADAGSLALAADALAVAWNANAVLRGWMTAASDGVDIVTLTGNNVGLVIDFASVEAGLTYALASAADDADPVPFGRAMIATGYATPADAQLDPDGTMLAGVLVAAAKFTAQVDTWTVADPGVGQFIGATVKVLGFDEVISERVPWQTDLDTTLDALATVINAALADAGLSAYVTAAGPAGAPGPGEFVFTAAIAGVEFASVVTCDDAAGYPVISLASNKALATSFLRAFAGASIRATDEVPSQVGTTSSSYGPNRGVRVLAEGPMWVESSQSPTYGTRVYVGTGSGEEGRFYNSAGAGRLPLPLSVARWLYSARSGEGDEAAVVRFLANV